MDDTTSMLVPNQMMPIKHGTSTISKFTTNHKYRQKEVTDMGNEMRDYIVGPMPVTKFLDEFFPKKPIDTASKDPPFKKGCFKKVISCSCETQAYKPFVGLFIMITPCD